LKCSASCTVLTNFLENKSRAKQKNYTTFINSSWGIFERNMRVVIFWTMCHLSLSHKIKALLKPSWQTVIVSYFWAKHKHETHTLLRLSLIMFLSTHILQRGKGLVDYQGREQQGWGPVWLLHHGRKLVCTLWDCLTS